VPGSARGSMCVPPYASEASSRPRQMRGQAGRGVGGDRRSNGPGRSACIRGRGIPARNCSAMLAGLRGFCSSSRLEHHASARCGQSRGAVLAHPVPPLGAAPRSHVARVGVSRCAPSRRRGRPPASGQKAIVANSVSLPSDAGQEGHFPGPPGQPLRSAPRPPVTNEARTATAGSGRTGDQASSEGGG
jgi:hypothetical protein